MAEKSDPKGCGEAWRVAGTVCAYRPKIADSSMEIRVWIHLSIGKKVGSQSPRRVIRLSLNCRSAAPQKPGRLLRLKKRVPNGDMRPLQKPRNRTSRERHSDLRSVCECSMETKVNGYDPPNSATVLQDVFRFVANNKLIEAHSRIEESFAAEDRKRTGWSAARDNGV
jgi:hypothetical protein